MITSASYKGRDAVIVESGKLRATILPDDGAKMASLVDLQNGKELLATKGGDTYKVLGVDGSYVDSECSAFDDMFPTIEPYTPQSGENRGITYPDHGEVCRLPFEVSLAEDAATFSVKSRLFPYAYQKTVSLAPDGGLEIRYVIENDGDEAFESLWAGHVMLRGEDGMRLLTPFSEEAPIEMIFATDGYDTEKLPRDRLCGFEPNVGAAYKFYYSDKMREGYFGVRYADGRTLTFTFDEQKLPYLGVWLNNGEFQGIYNVAPEPCTVPFDAPHKAKAKGYGWSIPAKEKFEFSLHISMRYSEGEK